MHPLLNLLSTLPLVLYYIAEAIVLALIPRRFRSKDITGQTVLITGAGSGIGRQLAIQFSRLGTRLLLLDLNSEGLEDTRSLLDKNSDSAFLYECDVSDRVAVYATADRIRQEVGTVDIVVSNAGFCTGKKFMECPDELIQRTFEVNTMAQFWMCKAFLPDMKSRNKGHIVFVASVAGLGGFPLLTDYSSSKHGVVGFEESLRLELEEEGLSGIKTTVACPYLVNTGFFNGLDIPIMKPLTPEYVAEKIISGILVEREIIVIPIILGFLFVAKGFIPRIAVRAFYKGAGIIKNMEKSEERTYERNGKHKNKLRNGSKMYEAQIPSL